MKNVDTIMKAINLSNYDGVKSLEVSIEDLLCLRSEIEYLRRHNLELSKQTHILDTKLALKSLESPIKLDLYI